MRPGLINVDFADVKTVMSEMGMAVMGTGIAKGEERAREATESAIRSPLLEDIDLNNAKGILVNITAGLDMNLCEFSDVGATIDDFASPDANVVIGTVIDPEMSDELKVTVVATGLSDPDGSSHKATEPVQQSSNDPFGVPDFISGYTRPGSTKSEAAAVVAEVPKPTYQEATYQNDADHSRNQRSFSEPVAPTSDDQYDERLEVPAFLRKQAD